MVFAKEQIEKVEQEQVKRFKEDVINLCMSYGLSIAHEDGQGNFIIEDFKESNIDWFNNAQVDLTGLDN